MFFKTWTKSDTSGEFHYAPFHGDELLQVYTGFLEKTLGHFCEACDHCSLMCQDVTYGGGMHRGAGWCWHGLTWVTPNHHPENETGICVQACHACLAVVCELHYILRILGETYQLPREMLGKF